MEHSELMLLPAVAIRNITTFKRQLEEVYEQNMDLISIWIDSFSYTSKEKRFKFRVADISLAPNKTDASLQCKINYSPASTTSVKNTELLFPLEKIIDIFKKWISNVKEYQDAVNEYKDPFYKQFEKEFEDSFGEEKEEDKFSTLDSDGQLKFYKLIEFIEKGLTKEDTSNPEIKKLISFINELKENIPYLPKSALKKKSIKLISELKRLGIKLYYDTLEIGYKETIKAILISGFHAIGSIDAGHIISQVLQ